MDKDRHFKIYTVETGTRDIYNITVLHIIIIIVLKELGFIIEKKIDVLFYIYLHTVITGTSTSLRESLRTTTYCIIHTT